MYVVGTPLGNLGDITLRALDVLRGAGCVAAEDTRRTRYLLRHFDITVPVVRYDDHTHARAAPKLLARLEAGEDVAQVTDAGMPGISDPGLALASAARAAGHRVEVVPGPDAVTTALVASGLPTAPYTFHGFLPRKAGERARLLGSLAPGTHVFYESPERLARSARALADAHPAAQVAVCRELTKKFETILRGAAADLVAQVPGRARGEVVVVVHLADPGPAEVDDATLRAAVRELQRDGSDKKTAIGTVAGRFGVPKRRVYALTIRENG